MNIIIHNFLDYISLGYVSRNRKVRSERKIVLSQLHKWGFWVSDSWMCLLSTWWILLAWEADLRSRPFLKNGRSPRLATATASQRRHWSRREEAWLKARKCPQGPADGWGNWVGMSQWVAIGRETVHLWMAITLKRKIKQNQNLCAGRKNHVSGRSVTLLLVAWMCSLTPTFSAAGHLPELPSPQISFWERLYIQSTFIK